MLATPEPSPDAVWKRVVESTGHGRSQPGSSIKPIVYVEDKFDGIRAQLHRSKDKVEIFSRDLKRITAQFPELAQQAMNFEHELIADGEIIAFAQGQRLTFFDLQKRLGRRDENANLFAGATADVPVAFVIFDLLWLNGRSLLNIPLRDRRGQLLGVGVAPRFLKGAGKPPRSAPGPQQNFFDVRRRIDE